MLTEVVAAFIREEANANPLITVTRLDIAPNYRNVKVLFTTIPSSGEQDALGETPVDCWLGGPL